MKKSFLERKYRKRIKEYKKLSERSQGGVCAVLFGGAGYEHSVSVVSGARFIAAAQKLLYNILPIYIDKSGFYAYFGECGYLSFDSEPTDGALVPAHPMRCGEGSGFLVGGEFIRVSRAVPILHGDFGEDGRIQGLLESLCISFCGAGTVSGAVCADKAYTKAVAESVGISVLSGFSVTRKFCEVDAERAERELGYPIFVKPCRLGSSIGASLANCREELVLAADTALSFSDRILIERALTSPRELECAYLNSGGFSLITSPGEAVCGKAFYDYDAKYNSRETKLFAKADVTDSVKKKLADMTERLALALDVRDFARFDYFLDGDGSIYFNEVNTVPGMTEGSLFPAMLENAGVDYNTFVSLAVTGRTPDGRNI